MNGSKFIILLGSSNLLYSCARIIKKFYQERAVIKVIDTAYTPLKRRYIPEFGRIDEYKSKDEVFSYLDTLDIPVFLLSINNPYIIPIRFSENPLFTIINLHHALLPNHPGRNAEAWTIYNQDLNGGITWHYISGSGIDTGDIICRREVEITDTITSLSLLKACEKAAMESLITLLPFEKLHDEKAEKQETYDNVPKRAVDIPNNGYLDWNWDIFKMSAFLRALDYGMLNILGKPKCFWQGKDFIVEQYEISNVITSLDREITYDQTGKDQYLIIAESGKQIKLKITI